MDARHNRCNSFENWKTSIVGSIHLVIHLYNGEIFDLVVGSGLTIYMQCVLLLDIKKTKTSARSLWLILYPVKELR